tara:strand:- start:1625 stop:2251 length:627 start_codon:yes stop_codon:yes gene_type:complete
MTSKKIDKGDGDLISQIMGDDLTEKQSLFIIEFMIDLNGTQAWMRATGCENKKTAGTESSKTLKIPKVREALKQQMNARAARTLITADKVLHELSKLAFSNIGGVYDSSGDLIPVHELDSDVAASIQEVTEDQMGSEDGGAPIVIKRKYKLADKRSSLDLLGKHLKLFGDSEKIEVTVQSVMPVPTADSVEDWEESAKKNQDSILSRD